MIRAASTRRALVFSLRISGRCTVSCVKTAITVPADVLADVDRAARSHGESRSKYITRVLRTSVRVGRDAEITARLNELFAAEETKSSQHRETAVWDEASAPWNDERW